MFLAALDAARRITGAAPRTRPRSPATPNAVRFGASDPPDAMALIRPATRAEQPPACPVSCEPGETRGTGGAGFAHCSLIILLPGVPSHLHLPAMAPPWARDRGAGRSRGVAATGWLLLPSVQGSPCLNCSGAAYPNLIINSNDKVILLLNFLTCNLIGRIPLTVQFTDAALVTCPSSDGRSKSSQNHSGNNEVSAPWPGSPKSSGKRRWRLPRIKLASGGKRC